MIRAAFLVQGVQQTQKYLRSDIFTYLFIIQTITDVAINLRVVLIVYLGQRIRVQLAGTFQRVIQFNPKKSQFPVPKRALHGRIT